MDFDLISTAKVFQDYEILSAEKREESLSTGRKSDTPSCMDSSMQKGVSKGYAIWFSFSSDCDTIS
jgi:hypothetical protein